MIPHPLNRFGFENKVPLTFTSVAPSRHWMRCSVAGNVDGSGLKYRFGKGGPWLDYEAGTLIWIDPDTSIQFMNSKNVLGNSAANYANFSSGGLVKASGNVMSMLNWREDVPVNAFTYLFANLANLITPPELPAKLLSDRCYFQMFKDCTSLIKAPRLPAKSIKYMSYNGMFKGCTSLLYSPDLKADSVTTYGCVEMFYGCTSLIKAPKLSATSLAPYCYNAMFHSCSSLVQAPELPATTLANYCYYNMFQGCT